jgi:hypothetical protein
MDYRKDEVPKTWFRSDRVFRSDGQWFFHTREGIGVGPYKTRFEAEIDAGMLKSLLMDADPGKAKSIIREFLLYADTAPAELTDSAFTDYVVEEAGELFDSGTA